ncbi:thyroglobulin type-1 repeat-containing protein [Nocardia sp. XZ_19_369]|uniref:thyroglobulin type-1 repeat-containing protein n=1 Tax=Nocardia sp. XZ_19_369 TaxID=2769487 RepID=UPI001890158D|nr:thyroglobulin type-1 repeat-containing protein [Nocardia sp. XZ_19_369]
MSGTGPAVARPIAEEGTQTDCQKDAVEERAEDSGRSRIIPRCDKNGDYEALQCDESSRFCQVWDPKTGVPLTQPSSKLKRADCILARHYAEERGKKPPMCAQDGGFAN